MSVGQSKGKSHDCHVRSHDGMVESTVNPEDKKMRKTLVKEIVIREPFVVKLKEPFIDEDIDPFIDEDIKLKEPFVDEDIEPFVEDVRIEEGFVKDIIPFVEADIKLKEPQDLKISGPFVEDQVTSQDQKHDLSDTESNVLHLDYSSSSSESSGDKDVTVRTKMRRKR